MLQGIFTPNIVPFHADHRVNEGELRRMIDWLIQKGVSGLYPNGSTGEFIRLSFEQRKQVVRIVADETRGRVPILAGAAEPNLDLILEAAKEFADLGCRAISVTGPYYFKVSQESIETMRASVSLWKRCRSVSSSRRMNRPPWWRANA